MENLNEIMVNEEVVEATEDIIAESSGNDFKTITGIGLAVLGGVIAYKRVIKPMIVKIKMKKEQQVVDEELSVTDDINNESIEEEKFEETE